MSLELPPYRPIKRRSGLSVMFAAIHALFMRELQTRFGSYRLGYLWALIEPGFQVLLYVVLFGAIMKRAMYGIDYPVFLAAGLVPWFMFQKNATRALGAVQANQGLLLYRPVRPIDTVLARFLLEFVIYFAVFFVFAVGLTFFGYKFFLGHLDIVILCWLSLGLFAFGFSLIMMVLGHYFEEVSKLISIIFTLAYFASGVIYSIHIIPEPYQSYLLLNPVIHNLENIRHAFSPSYPVHHIDFGYFLKSTMVVLFLGFLLYEYAEKDMVRSR